MSELFQIHLSAKGMSGRGVRYAMLGDAALDRNDIEAAKSAREGAINQEVWAASERLGMEQMIRELTEPGVTDLTTATWKKVTLEEIATGWSKFFNAKDTAALRRAYKDKHSATAAELDAIMGKEAVVLAD
jgi:hypothetical protein